MQRTAQAMGGGVESDVRNSYQYVIELRERLEQTLKIAHDNLDVAQTRQKLIFDRKAKVRQLKEGDEVLVMLPTDANKLLMQWKGPFSVTGRIGRNDYKVRNCVLMGRRGRITSIC